MKTETTTRELIFNMAINEAIRQEMQHDETVILLGEDVAGAAGRAHIGLVDAWGGPSRVIRGLIKEFGPERVIDTPIAESGFLGAAIGAAMTGLRPIVEVIMVDFIGVCYDQIINQAAKMHYMMGGQVELPLVLRTAYGISSAANRSYGGGAAAQHSQTLYSVLAHIPGLKVVVPSNPYNAKGLTISAIRDNGPVVVMENKAIGTSLKGYVPKAPYTIPIGRAEITRSGRDITLCGIGHMTHVCLQAADMLAADGISVEVVDVLTLAPLDETTILESVERTRRLIIVDEDTPTASMARDIAARVADKGFSWLDAPIKTVTAPDTPVPFSAVLEDQYVPNPANVVSAVQELMGCRRKKSKIETI